MRAARARCNYANFNHHLLKKKTSHASFCFFGTSKLVSSEFLLPFTLVCFREKNGAKSLTISLNKFCLHAVVKLRI